MPKKIERPFNEGLTGEMYAQCYSQPKTGYRIAKDMGKPTNMVYKKMKKEGRENLFKVVGETRRGADLLLANEALMVEAIKDDLAQEGVVLRAAETDALREFFDNTWRDIYKTISEGDTPKKTPFTLFLGNLGVKVAYTQYAEKLKKQYPQLPAVLEDLGLGEEITLFKKVGEVTGLPAGEAEKAVEKTTEIFDVFNFLPEELVYKLAEHPDAKTGGTLFSLGMGSPQNLVNMLPAVEKIISDLED